MIVLFLVLAFLRTLQGAPLSTPTPPTFDSNAFLVRDATTGSTCTTNLRTTYGIVRSCILTILACVWSSGHPNIAGPRDAGWTCLKRRVLTTLSALIAPEVVVFWALRQYFAANRIARDYNENFVKLEVQARPQMSAEHHELIAKRKGFCLGLKGTFMALWNSLRELSRPLRNGVKEWFTILPKDVTRRGDGQAWTNTHGFFIQMGGFLLYENGYPTRVLGYDDLKELIEKCGIDAPTVTERELQDRSKGDAISKAFVVFQTTWFVIQCFARLCQHLPLSELEVVTLAFAVLNAIIYAVWWNKPQGVAVAIWIPLKVKTDVGTEGSGRSEGVDRAASENRDAEESDGEVGTAETGMASDRTQFSPAIDIPAEHTETAQLFESRRTAVEDETPPENGWLRRQLEKDSSNYSWPIFAFVRVPYLCTLSLIRPFDKMTRVCKVPSGALRVPMFFADGRVDNSFTLVTVSSVIGTVFGAVHLLAWSSDFPSRAEHLLWWISALVITAEPVFLLMTGLFSEYGDMRGDGEWLTATFVVCFVLVVPFYVIARLVLITLAFLSLRTLPSQVFVQISWTSFIPHL